MIYFLKFFLTLKVRSGADHKIVLQMIDTSREMRLTESRLTDVRRFCIEWTFTRGNRYTGDDGSPSFNSNGLVNVPRRYHKIYLAANDLGIGPIFKLSYQYWIGMCKFSNSGRQSIVCEF